MKQFVIHSSHDISRLCNVVNVSLYRFILWTATKMISCKLNVNKIALLLFHIKHLIKETHEVMFMSTKYMLYVNVISSF